MSSNVEEEVAPNLDSGSSHEDLRRLIEHAAHFLPAQGPIEVFVHHNTLHAFEHLPFDQGVREGGKLYGCNPYLPEDHYRRELGNGRIRLDDLQAVLRDDLTGDSETSVAGIDNRYSLRLTMLQHPLRSGDDAELRWVMAETDARRRFSTFVEPDVREKMINETLACVSQDHHSSTSKLRLGQMLPPDSSSMGKDTEPDTWSKKERTSFVLVLLWHVCLEGVLRANLGPTPASNAMQRHRDLLRDVTGEDSDRLVHGVLVRLCAAFLDQGFADSDLPCRGDGLYASFLDLYGGAFSSPTRWLRELHKEVMRLVNRNMNPVQSIDESLRLLGVGESERSDFITSSLLALRGWAGMVWQMETNATWMPTPAPAGSLVEFLAVQLVLDRIALAYVARDAMGFEGTLAELRSACCHKKQLRPAQSTNDRLAFDVFQLAQLRGWGPIELQRLSDQQWVDLTQEIQAFDNLERRRLFHLAYERKYRNETLDAVMAHAKWQENQKSPDELKRQTPAFQVACCIDEREESFRRHLEELEPACETFGIAGFFGVAMYYRGSGDAHYKPLCPVNIRPQHYIVEASLYSHLQADQRRSIMRRRIGELTHQTHRGTRTFLGGILTGLLGSVAAFPLVARILFPRITARIRTLFGNIVTTNGTELRLERLELDDVSDQAARKDSDRDGSVKRDGYSVQEMSEIVEGGLRAMGLAVENSISRLFVVCGHGSASMNNPHEAAHDCGACGGGRGGPNARAFAQMANDLRVRRIIADRGLTIPDDSLFVGCYHNTCDDSLTWYDLDRLPLAHRPLFERAKAKMEQARKRSALERCRRFESAELTLSDEDALRHVEGRAEDLSQTRPEYGHATNALCFVGRREWSRDLFLDRRAFLTSYDPTQDDDRSTILEGMLQAVIPVCAGINLEYYFSNVDPTGYGCGTKLPHNITSLLGVMDGAFSDLRPGLPWQMVEIHEPVRLLCVIETTPDAMQRIIDDNPPISQLVNGCWVQLAVFEPAQKRIHRYVDGEFVPYEVESDILPNVATSRNWYSGQRDHLGFASIDSSPQRSSL